VDVPGKGPDRSIGGFVAPGFEAVRDAFATDPRGGSALTMLRGGRPVVDLWEGWRDVARTRPWDEDTLVNVYSVGKPVIALGLLLLVERGRRSLDDRVPRFWPQFQTDTSVREILAHTAALPSFRWRGTRPRGRTGICSARTWPRLRRNVVSTSVMESTALAAPSWNTTARTGRPGTS
jgi:CubicO group peptidase (beta-lactamase class C family)